MFVCVGGGRGVFVCVGGWEGCVCMCRGVGGVHGKDLSALKNTRRFQPLETKKREISPK